MRPRYATLVAATAVVALSVAAPAPAKKRPAPCTGRFLVEADKAPLAGGATRSASAAPDAIVVGKSSVMITSGCKAVAARPRHTKAGWKLAGSWKACNGGPVRAHLSATIDADCKVLHGSFKAKGTKVTTFVAATTQCGDRIVDRTPPANEECDPPAAGKCDQYCQLVPAVTPTTLPPNPVCGNGIVEPGEECDDGNTADGDGCTHDCKIASCGNGRTAFDSTFKTIQSAIFERHGCTASVCHGSSPGQGGLDLSPAVAYQNLFQVKSTEYPTFNRVEPGDQRRSLLWLKLALATDPTQIPNGLQVPPAPMPNGLAPLSKDELDAVRLWIYSGAPETGTVAGTDGLLNACLPPPEPIIIQPLDPPPPGQGLQFVMPPWHLEAHSEHEICFATYYDFTDQVPAEFQDPSGTLFRFKGQELRQDPQSHHLLLYENFRATNVFDPAYVHDPSFGAWACNGGETPGATCEPTDKTSCGTGTCTSEIKQSFACIGFGPQTGGPTLNRPIGGAQKAQASETYYDGVFGQLPMKGVVYWNSHAFNLTDQDTTMHARINYYFAQNQKYPIRSIFDISSIFAPNAAPYTTQTVCNDHVLPQGARLFNLSSHTHKRGKQFTITGPDGTLLYQNFVYNDPADITFTNPLAFDSPVDADRTLHYCALYNNGVAADGSPDPTTVTRRSKTPASALAPCVPVACAAGKIGAPCAGVGDDRTCDSSQGSNDGACDACKITGGESTENEMFLLLGAAFVQPPPPPPVTSGLQASAVAGLDANGRSTSTEIAVGPVHGCMSHSGMDHAGMNHAAMHAGN